MDSVVLDRYFEENRTKLIEDIAALIRIPSTRGLPRPGQPYGEAPAQALSTALAIAERLGFRTTNYDNYVGTVDFGTLPARLDILAHLDVVPAGEHWTVTDPFKPKLQEGRLYGRGAADDKGPAIAVLYAMHALKSAGVPVSGNVRLILGTDEECGSSDLEYYYQKQPEAPMSFSPDADFPLINVEKGRFTPSFSTVWEESGALPRLCSVTSGVKVNMVPDTATAVVEGLSNEVVERACAESSRITGIQYQVTATGGRLEIRASGASAHASTPEKGRNALTALLSLLCELPFAECRAIECLQKVSQWFPYGDFYGNGLGIAMEDTESGALTASLNVFSLSPTGMSGQCDCRVPCCATEENSARIVEKAFLEAGLQGTVLPFWQAHRVPAHSPLVKTLLHAYETVTGEKGTCMAIGGITYVHHLKNGVAFGCAFPGTDNRMHGDDEFIDIEQLITAAKIFAVAIEALCR